MITVNTPQKTREQRKLRCQTLLGVLIVNVDPSKRSPVSLANKIGYSRALIYRALEQGRCGRGLAEALQKEFGPVLAPVEDLCWPKIDI